MSKIVSQRNYVYGLPIEDNQLLCPVCKEPWLHHIRVQVFERGEDATTGLHVTVSGEEVFTDGKMDDNPSKRRHGLSIEFWCECCGRISVLEFAQHKGKTLFSWIDTGEESNPWEDHQNREIGSDEWDEWDEEDEHRVVRTSSLEDPRKKQRELIKKN